MNTTPQNPYVGPRTFQREDGDLFFGREREARDLMALATSERIILFYAQSGAGKSSLLNTRLLPELERSNFEVLPVGRLQGEAPADLEVENIYLFNLMSSMVQQRFSPQALVGLALSQFLAVLEFHDGGYLLREESLTEIIQEVRWRRVLIIDQFEEIFTTHLASWSRRDEFFRQLAEALQDDPYLTIILIMREDYIASLDPFAHLLPGGLRMRYYMQRLSRTAALKAIKNPVETVRPYAEGVAEKLVDDLANITVYKPDGTHETQLGQYIEPVQLQVVCYGLWEDLPPDRDMIAADDLLEVGDVDQSLERFFDRRAAAVAQQMSIPERDIREWFEGELITSNRTRNMVLQDSSETARLHDSVIRTMRGDLIRAELRAGQIWYELSHDRLIKPIITSNAKWFETHLSTFQRRVVLWEQQGKSESLLLTDRELAEAEKEAKTLPLTSDESEFLEDCRILQKRLRRDRTQRRVIFGALIISLMLLVLSIFATRTARNAQAEALQQKSSAEQAQADAEQEKNTAEQAQAEAERQKSIAQDQASIALAGSLVAQADSLNNTDHTLAIFLGVEAYKRNPGDLTKTTLFNLLEFTAYKEVKDFDGNANSVAISPNGRYIAVASCNKDDCNKGEIRLYDETLKQIALAPGDYGIVNSLAFYRYADKLVLAAGGCIPKGCSQPSGQITLWEISDAGAAPLTQRNDHSNLIKTVRFSPDGKFLAIGSYDTTISFWDLTSLTNPKDIGVRLHHLSFVYDLAFSLDGDHLVSAGDDHTIYVWDISQKDNIPPAVKYNKDLVSPVTSVAFSPDGSLLASAGYDRIIRLWDWNAGKLSLKNTLTGHTGYITTLAFNRDGTLLASAGFDRQIILWDTNTGDQNGPPLKVHTKGINQLAFGPRDRNGNDLPLPYLISVSNDHTAIWWDIYSREPISPYGDYSDSQNENLLTNLDWVAIACKAVHGQKLTKDEWNTYLRLDNSQTYENDYQGTCP